MEKGEMAIKQHTILSWAVQLITNEYPEKFWFAKKINGSINKDVIIITGDLDILNSEVHERKIEFEEEETYKIVLKPSRD